MKKSGAILLLRGTYSLDFFMRLLDLYQTFEDLRVEFLRATRRNHLGRK